MKKLVAYLMIFASMPLLGSPQKDQLSPEVKISTDGDFVIHRTTKNVYPVMGLIANGLFPDYPGRTADLGPLSFAMKRALEKKEEVTLIIDSPGGVADEISFEFLETMDKFKEAGVPITCLVTGMASSLAAIIYSRCSDRYALASARVMWHSVASGFSGRINEQIAKKYYDEYHALNERFWKELKSFFGEEYFKKHFDAEDLVPAFELEKVGDGFLKLVRTISIVN